MIKPTGVTENLLQAIERKTLFQKIAQRDEFNPMFLELLSLYLVTKAIDPQIKNASTKFKTLQQKRANYKAETHAEKVISLPKWNSIFRLLLTDCFKSNETISTKFFYKNQEQRIDAVVEKFSTEVKLDGEFFRNEFKKTARRKRTLSALGIGLISIRAATPVPVINVWPKAFFYEMTLLPEIPSAAVLSGAPLSRVEHTSTHIGVDLFSDFATKDEIDLHEKFFRRKLGHDGEDPMAWPETKALIKKSGPLSSLTGELTFWSSSQYAKWALDPENMFLKKSHGPHSRKSHF